MTAITAILVDGYRELNSRKLFWIAFVLSTLIPLAFLAVDINEDGMKLAIWEFRSGIFNTNLMSREMFFRDTLFVGLGVGIWLTWIAAILALVTTAGIIPDFISGGAVDMVLSKPVRRSTLFLAKYFSGLLFAGLQVMSFTLMAFLVIGIKIDQWMFGLFLAVPIVVAFFSYLFAICATIGLVTRSTMAALLLTLLAWFGLWILNTADTATLFFKQQYQYEVDRLEPRMEAAEALEQRILGEIAENGENENRRARLDALREQMKNRGEELDDSRDALDTATLVSNIIVGVKTPLPKTAETIFVLNRTIGDVARSADEAAAADAGVGTDENPFAALDNARMSDEQLGENVESSLGDRSVAWVIGTSLGFEAVLVLFCLWIFGRRDF